MWFYFNVPSSTCTAHDDATPVWVRLSEYRSFKTGVPPAPAEAEAAGLSLAGEDLEAAAAPDVGFKGVDAGVVGGDVEQRRPEGQFPVRVCGRC